MSCLVSFVEKNISDLQALIFCLFPGPLNLCAADFREIVGRPSKLSEQGRKNVSLYFIMSSYRQMLTLKCDFCGLSEYFPRNVVAVSKVRPAKR